ncbi:MAG: ABC transporter permease [Pirellulales bacterium]
MPVPDRIKAYLPGRAEMGLVAAIVVVLAATALLDTQHNYWSNPLPSAKDILRQSVMLGIFALGAAIVIIAGGIDLSAGSMIAFGGSVCAAVVHLLARDALEAGQPIGPVVIATAIAAALLAGFLVGSLHAWLITVVGLPPFVATLATLVGLRSLARIMIEQMTGGSTQLYVNDEQFRAIGTNLLWPAVLFGLLAVAAWVFLSKTVAGRHLYAVGGNEQAARLSGIKTDSVKWLAYCTSSMLAALAGVLYVSDLGTASPQTLARGYELNAIAAAVVGGCSLQGGVGTISGTVLGVLFLRIVIDSVAKIIKSNADTYEGLIVGAVVVLAVAINQLRQAARRGKRFFPGAMGAVAIINLSLLAAAVAAIVSRTSGGSASTAPDVRPRAALAGLAALAALSLFSYWEHRRK